MADLEQQLATRDQMVGTSAEQAILQRTAIATRDQVMTDLKQELEKRDRIIAKLREHPGSQGKRRKSHAKRSSSAG